MGTTQSAEWASSAQLAPFHGQVGPLFLEGKRRPGMGGVGALLVLLLHVASAERPHAPSLAPLDAARELQGGSAEFLQEKGAVGRLENDDWDAYNWNAPKPGVREYETTSKAGQPDDSFTVGVMPASVGEALSAAKKSYTSASSKDSKKGKYTSAADGKKGKYSSGGSPKEKAEKAKLKKEKDSKFASEKAEKKKNSEELATKKATEITMKGAEKSHKKAEFRLNAEQKRARAAEVKHKESERVHKNFIKLQLKKKEQKAKKKERKKKGQIIHLTKELNNKAESKKAALAGPKGGAMTAQGSFSLSSKFIEGKRQEKKTKKKMAATREKNKKAVLRKKETKKKKEITRKKVRIADAAEKIKKGKKKGEKNIKKVKAAKKR